MPTSCPRNSGLDTYYNDSVSTVSTTFSFCNFFYAYDYILTALYCVLGPARTISFAMVALCDATDLNLQRLVARKSSLDSESYTNTRPLVLKIVN